LNGLENTKELGHYSFAKDWKRNDNKGDLELINP
jgi:hypothetical protein